MTRMFNRGHYANVTSTLALILALSGTAYAANTIRSGDIVNGQVKRADLANNLVSSNKVKDGALLSRDFRAGELPPGPRGATGASGATGAPGAPGAKGDKGEPGLPATRLFANVDSAGALGATNQGATAAARAAAGQYSVTFNRALAGCVALAQVGIADGPGGSYSPNSVATVVSSSGPAVQVQLVTGSTGVHVDGNFNVAVFC